MTEDHYLLVTYSAHTQLKQHEIACHGAYSDFESAESTLKHLVSNEKILSGVIMSGKWLSYNKGAAYRFSP
jgi:hypothetical protein